MTGSRTRYNIIVDVYVYVHVDGLIQEEDESLENANVNVEKVLDNTSRQRHFAEVVVVDEENIREGPSSTIGLTGQ